MHDVPDPLPASSAWRTWLRWLALLPGMLLATIVASWVLPWLVLLWAPAYGSKTMLGLIIDGVLITGAIGASPVVAAFLIAPRFKRQVTFVVAAVYGCLLLAAAVLNVAGEHYPGAINHGLTLAGVVLAAWILPNSDDS